MFVPVTLAGALIVNETPGLTAVITAPAGMPVPETPWPTTRFEAAVLTVLEPSVVVPDTVPAFATEMFCTVRSA